MRIAFGLALLGAGCIYACGSSSGSNTPGGSAGADVGAAGDNGANGGSTSNGSAGKGALPSAGESGTGNGDAGEGGAAGSAPVTPVIISTALPHAAGGVVAGAVVAHSAHFTGVFSLGAAPGGNRTLTSANHQLRAGVIGASQK